MKQFVTNAHRNFLIGLVDGEVQFRLIGGYAVIYHGYPRFTKDLDIWLKPDNDNKSKLIPVLRTYGIVEKDITRVREIDFTQAHVFYIGEEPNQIDFLTKIAGVNYSETESLESFLQIKGREIPVIDFKHLIINKMVTDRPQDKADVAMLKKIRREQQSNN